MKKIYIALPILCSLPALHSCMSTQPKQEIWGMKPIYNVQHGGGNARDYYQLGRYFQGQNRLDQAAEAYQKALLLDASHIEAHNALGAIYSTQGKFEQAIVEFNTVIERAPQAAHLFNNLGYTYFLQKKYPEAIETFEKALALDPRHERSLNNLAQAYTQNGNSAKAAEILARVDALNGKVAASPVIASAQPPAAAPAMAAASPAVVADASAPSTKPEPAAPSIPEKSGMVATTPAAPQNLEKISAGEQTSVLIAAPTVAAKAPTVTLTVAATPMQNLEKLSPAERAALVAVPAPALLRDQTPSPSAAVKPAATESSPSASTAVVAAQPVVATPLAAAPAAEKSVGYSVMTELPPELKSLPTETRLIALADFNNPVTKQVKPNPLKEVALAVTESKAAQPDNKTSFEKITEAALKELTPNSVKLRAAKDMVAGIFRGVGTAFSDLVNGRPFRLEIANGNGVSGLAKKVGQVLTSSGLPAAQITNYKNYQQRQTVVQYRNGYQAQATALSKGLRNNPQLVQTANLRPNTDVRLVLGRDVKTQTALFEVEADSVKLAIGKEQVAKLD